MIESQGSLDSLHLGQENKSGRVSKLPENVIEEASVRDEESVLSGDLASRRNSRAMSNRQMFIRSSSRRFTDKPKWSEGLNKLRIEKTEEYNFLEKEFKPLRLEDKLIDHIIKDDSVCLKVSLDGSNQLGTSEIKIENVDLSAVEIDLLGNISNLSSANSAVRKGIIDSLEENKKKQLKIVREQSFMFLAYSYFEIDYLKALIEKKIKKLKKKV